MGRSTGAKNRHGGRVLLLTIRMTAVGTERMFERLEEMVQSKDDMSMPDTSHIY